MPATLGTWSAAEMIGHQIGKYRILNELGRGGMGVVYKAVQTTLNRTVCIKVLSPHLAGSGEYLARFEREAESLARVAHENIVHIYDVESFEGRQCIVMEYVGGPSLTQLLAQKQRLAPAHARDIAYALAGALAVAHRKGIVHRDIKPDNILFSLDGRPKLTDFGIARMRDSKVKTQTGLMLGTPYYMSPEQARGQSVGASSDLYSLGVVLYEMLSGQLPFMADDALAIALQHIQAAPPRLEESAPDVPRELTRLVHRMLEKDPERRLGSMDELRSALAALELGLPAGSALAREAVAPELAKGGLGCPECHAPILPDYLTCPSCGLAIRQQCGGCSRLYDPLADSCPACRTPSTPAPAPASPVPSPPARVAPVPAGGAGASDTIVPGGAGSPHQTIGGAEQPGDRFRHAAAAAAGVAMDAGSALAEAGSALVDAAGRVPLPSQTFVGRVWESTRRRMGSGWSRPRNVAWAGAAILLLGTMVATAMQLSPDRGGVAPADSLPVYSPGGGPTFMPAGPQGGRRQSPPAQDRLTPEQVERISGLIDDSTAGPVAADTAAIVDPAAPEPDPVSRDVKEAAADPVAAARQAIASVVERQRRATESGDVELFLRDLDEELADENLGAFQNLVRNYRNRTSRITQVQITFEDGETAHVRFHARVTGVRTSNGRAETLHDGSVEWVVERYGNRWLIVWSS